MKDIYLVRYSVSGIKTLKELVTLSFYKKTFTKDMDTRGYNVKGIYGMNGSGKSAIITSVDILKNLLLNYEYLNNIIVQNSLDEIINKELGELFIETDYVINFVNKLIMFRYSVKLKKDFTGKYVISYEKLSTKRADSLKNSMETIIKVENGVIVDDDVDVKNDMFLSMFEKKTMNLLETSSICALFDRKVFYETEKDSKLARNVRFFSLAVLHIFGSKLHVYLDNSDDHKNYLLRNSLIHYENFEDLKSNRSNNLIREFLKLDCEHIYILSYSNNAVYKEDFDEFQHTVKKLCEFLKIFKSDLQNIEIDKKEDKDIYVCNLLMVYDSYKIHGEFESTGIKKLIRLFAYLKEMVCGGIVFIDEFDSNLHDVYLCALLEYLMENAKGQLCFTTHNVGPMDILKRNKKSIDFLSEDHKIYPWKNSGNYSPSRLYRNGMIEGSPFNIDSIDFIGIFDEEDE